MDNTQIFANNLDGEREILHTLEPHEAKRMRGVYLTVDGNNMKQTEVMR